MPDALQLEHPSVWPKLDLKIDSGVPTSLLDEVRTIRNDVMHFDPDPMTPDELAVLKRASRLMQELYEYASAKPLIPLPLATLQSSLQVPGLLSCCPLC